MGVSHPCVTWVVFIELSGKEAPGLLIANYFYPSEIPQHSSALVPHTSLSKQVLRKAWQKNLQGFSQKRWCVDHLLHNHLGSYFKADSQTLYVKQIPRLCMLFLRYRVATENLRIMALRFRKQEWALLDLGGDDAERLTLTRLGLSLQIVREWGQVHTGSSGLEQSISAP